MSQTIFLPSGKYLLEFYYQVDAGGAGTRLFASVGGQQVFSEVDQAGHGYIRATVNFHAEQRWKCRAAFRGPE